MFKTLISLLLMFHSSINGFYNKPYHHLVTTKKQLHMKMVPMIYSEEEMNPMNRFIMRDNIHMETRRIEEEMNYDPLFIIVWYSCIKCDVLLEIMEMQDMKFIFIDIRDTVEDKLLPYIGWDEPLVYKDEEYIGGWFELYSEIYPM